MPMVGNIANGLKTHQQDVSHFKPQNYQFFESNTHGSTLISSARPTCLLERLPITWVRIAGGRFEKGSLEAVDIAIAWAQARHKAATSVLDSHC
jgi:hypothetical protein